MAMSFELVDSIPTAPFGYKPIKHRECGEIVGWVRSYVRPGMKARSQDVLDLEGNTPAKGTRAGFHCPKCDKTVFGLKEYTIA